MPGTVISSRAGERSGKTCSRRPVSRSPTTALPSGSTTRPVGTVSPEATTLGSPPSSPGPGSRRLAGHRAALRRRRPDLGRRALGQRAERAARLVAVVAAAGQQHGGEQRGEQPGGAPSASAVSPGSQYVRARGWPPRVRAVPQLTSDPDEPLHVLVPSRAIGAAAEALSPRVRAHRSTRPTARRPARPRGRRSGCRARAAPPSPTAASSTRCPGCGWCSCSAPVRRGSPAGCPRACCSATPGARTPRRRRSGRWPRPSPPSGASRSSSASRTPAAGRSRTARLAGRRPGAGRRRRRHRPRDRPDAGRLRRRAHLRGAHRAGRRAGPPASCRELLPQADVVISSCR